MAYLNITVWNWACKECGYLHQGIVFDSTDLFFNLHLRCSGCNTKGPKIKDVVYNLMEGKSNRESFGE